MKYPSGAAWVVDPWGGYHEIVVVDGDRVGMRHIAATTWWWYPPTSMWRPLTPLAAALLAVAREGEG